MCNQPSPAPGPEAATQATAQRHLRDARLEKALQTILVALAALGIDHVEAEVKLAEAKRVQGVVAYTQCNETRDLSVTGRMTFEWGEAKHPCDNLSDFIARFLSAVLAHQPDEFLSDGIVRIWVGTGAVVQPVDYTARDAAQTKARVEKLRTDKVALITALKQLDVALVEAEYDGEGDSGQINDICAYKADNTTVDLSKTGPLTLGEGEQDAKSYDDLRQFIDEFAWEVLWHHHEGFENNDGGFGKVVIDVNEGTVEIWHNWRISSSEYTEAEF